MTRLLVSVRSAAEAQIALAAGADLIDVKEPQRGALGAADRSVIAEVIQIVAGAVPVSAALGELLDLDLDSDAEQLSHLPAGLSYVKFGLAGCRSEPTWPDRWQRVLRQLPDTTRPVAVVYADWKAANAPAPADVLRVARRLQCAALLVDTFDKTQGSLLDLWSLTQLAELMAAAADAGLLTAAAGSLTLAAIERIVPLGLDYIAVRGAACGGDRQSSVSAPLVQQLAAMVHASVVDRAYTRTRSH